MTRGDMVKLWLNTARLQEKAGKHEEAAWSRATARRVRETNAWLRRHGKY
jgi:hypothetical protein